MQVILQQDVKKMGKKGDVIEVKEGYGRNYLIPQGLAIEATNENLNIVKSQNKRKIEKADREKQAALEMAAKLKGIALELKGKAGENGKLFGAITAKDIAEALEKEHKLKIDKKKIVLEENIKALGEYTLKVKLYPEMSADLNLKIISE